MISSYIGLEFYKKPEAHDLLLRIGDLPDISMEFCSTRLTNRKVRCYNLFQTSEAQGLRYFQWKRLVREFPEGAAQQRWEFLTKDKSVTWSNFRNIHPFPKSPINPPCYLPRCIILATAWTCRIQEHRHHISCMVRHIVLLKLSEYRFFLSVCSSNF